MPMDDQTTNAFQSPEAEDDVRPLAAHNPLAVQRANALGLILWAGWLMVVLVAIVWLVG
jgi:hypothetical protein